MCQEGHELCVIISDTENVRTEHQCLTNAVHVGLQHWTFCCLAINLLKPTGHEMHQQFDIQQLYVLPTLYLCVLYLSENNQRLVTLTA